MRRNGVAMVAAGAPPPPGGKRRSRRRRHRRFARKSAAATESHHRYPHLHTLILRRFLVAAARWQSSSFSLIFPLLDGFFVK